jgi:hypothetical protein
MSTKTPVPRDFFCEHTAAKSRVFVLLASPGKPDTLRAVLASTDQVLAERAASTLGALARAGGGATIDADIEQIAASFPAAPAASFRETCRRIRDLDWPETDTGPVPWNQFQAGNEDNDHLTPATRDALTRTPSDARLAQLTGKAFRVIQFLEYHVHDAARLLAASAADGCPLLSDEDDQADPDDDLLDALMHLADTSHQVPGADIITQESSGQILTGDPEAELADWQREPVTAEFGGGWRLGNDNPDEAPTRPDFAALFPVRSCDLSHGSEEERYDCDVCGDWQLTPRTADTLHAALVILSDEAHEEADEKGDDQVPDKNAGDWFLFDRLPRITWGADAKWRRRFGIACEDLAQDLAEGHWPLPRCTAEEMALHLAIQDAPGHLETQQEARDERHAALPEYPDDYNWDTCSELFFEDHDVLMLFDASLDGLENPDNDLNQHIRIGDLRAATWFKPFSHLEPRDPDRTLHS